MTAAVKAAQATTFPSRPDLLSLRMIRAAASESLAVNPRNGGYALIHAVRARHGGLRPVHGRFLVVT